MKQRFPMGQMMLARAAGKRIARVLGYTAIPVLMAPLPGPALVGAMLKYAVWPWLFYVNFPIGILAVYSRPWCFQATKSAFRTIAPRHATILFFTRWR